MTDQEFAELRTLLDALCEEVITAEQMARLEELVLAHPQAEAHYVQTMSQHADLMGHFGGHSAPKVLRASGKPAAAPAAPQPWLKSRRGLVWGALGVSGLAAAVLLAVWTWPRPQLLRLRPDLAAEALDDTVAVLVQTHDAVWEETGLPHRLGAALPPGWLKLQSGIALVEFYSGAQVILEGPAYLKLISRTEAYCARGKLRATVPPQAQGFTIGSPKLDLVDRGTEFGLSVGDKEQTEVHVFDGLVELHDPASKRAAVLQALKTDQGVRFEGPGDLRPIKSDRRAFTTAQELSRLSETEAQGRQKDWQAFSDKLRKDASVLVCYTFENNERWSRTLLDQAQERKQPRDGAIVGCAWALGRWPGTKSLDFKRVSDRVRVHVPGEYDSLTLAAWVRVDGLPNRNNSLFMSDGWEPGELHWQIGDDGTLILGVQTDPKKGAHYHATEVITADRLGRWLHLAVVYDRENGVVTHYIDGETANQVPIQFEIPLRIGDAELGNWNVATHRNNTPVRFLSGGMDEFLLVGQAWSAERIAELYKLGRPAP